MNRIRTELHRRLRIVKRRAWAIVAITLALSGCGGKVVVDADPSGTSSGAGGAGSSSSATTATTVTTGQGGGSMQGTTCSAEAGIGCPADQFCDYPDDRCGQQKVSGTCTPRPAGCPPTFQPTCGCDMTVHATPCDAQREGTDLSTVKWCVPPSGTFQCGAFFCTVGKEYCEHLVVDQGVSETASCKTLPACGPSCDCLLGASCGSTCSGTPEGGVEVFCPASP